MKIDTIVRPLSWDGQSLRLLDQRKLPGEEVYLPVNTMEQCRQAIADMVVRGAPLIGFTALWGLWLWLRNHPEASLAEFQDAAHYLRKARPTAVNLGFEIDLAMKQATTWTRQGHPLASFLPVLEKFSRQRMEKLAEDNLRMAELTCADMAKRGVPHELSVLTICNTGVLACGCLGTALGVITMLAENKRLNRVFACETRPFLQGSRLTSYELGKQGIEHELVVEGAAAHLMGSGLVDTVFAGADRIAANGDSANKIGTASLAVIARHFKIPFYILAPLSTFHLEIASGKEIPIEIRSEEEILSCQGHRIAPPGARAYNPAFDVTPAENITAIVCEKGVISPVTEANLRRITAL